METFKKITLTASQFVDDFTSLEEVDFLDIKDRAQKMAKSLPKHPHVLVDEIPYSKEVINIDYNEKEMTAIINYKLVDATSEVAAWAAAFNPNSQ